MIRQSKYLETAVEQDQRAFKCVPRPMLGFKSFSCARIISKRYRTDASDGEKDRF